jgi:hypothetical protein
MMPSAPPDAVPAPPPGPGAVAPFAAPPRDRDRRGLWIGLGAGGLVLALCCVGGFLGIVFLIPVANDLGKAQVAAVVRDYLTALQNQDYETAHDEYLCNKEQSNHSVAWFEDHYGAAKVTGFTVSDNDVRFEQDILVLARVTQQGLAPQTMRYVMSQDGARYVICGGVE